MCHDKTMSKLRQTKSTIEIVSGVFNRMNSRTKVGKKMYVYRAMRGYLAHKKTPPFPRTAIGPLAWSYCRVLGGAFSYERGTPVPCHTGGGVSVERKNLRILLRSPIFATPNALQLGIPQVASRLIRSYCRPYVRAKDL